jgi:N-acetylglucosamine kinase-like BadF-type ATPase
MFGDIGSGYWIGMEILRAVSLALDQMGPPTVLHQLLISHIGTSDVKGWAYSDSEHHNWHRVAALAPLLFDAFAQGDKGNRNCNEK